MQGFCAMWRLTARSEETAACGGLKPFLVKKRFASYAWSSLFYHPFMHIIEERAFAPSSSWREEAHCEHRE